MERILRDLLDFSKPQNLKITKQNVNGLLDMVTDQMEDELEKGGCRIEKSFSESIPSIRMDMDRLSQVFINVLLNARQAMPDGGVIRIYTEVAAETGSVMIGIHDSGKGMDQETAGKIFDPFFSTRDEGTGLGLTICRQIVEAHGGTIRLQSSPGKGTNVLVELPITASDVK